MSPSSLAFRPRHALFRTTFLRGHVGTQLSALDEVLALKLLADDLERNLRRKPTADERRLLLDDFFGREESDRWLYLPLALVPHAGDRPILPPDHLTCLSDYLARPPQGAPGVLLAARSGAGKTTAGIKAFRDCIVQPRGADHPPLADRIPVRLRLSGLSAVAETLTALRGVADKDPAEGRRRAGQVDSPRIVEELLLVAAGLTAPLESLHQWLKYGPPLLLFLDLNTADNEAVRLAVARSLSRFQEDYAPFGHRCIVTYRSTESNDAAMTALREREGALFRTFDLAPIDAANAVAYLRHLRTFESDVYGHFELSPPRHDIERECRTLEEFVQRYAVQRESLISTPLIMELVATLRPGDVETIHSLADLYERVTKSLLYRHQRMTAEYDQKSAILAMVRLSLAIISRGPTATRLEGLGRFSVLSEHPEYGRRGEHPWHPTGSFWLGPADNPCPYYSGAIQPAERFRERTLFAAREDSIGFLHDSFVYYFAAYALRYHDGPGCPPADVGVDPDAWPGETATRILPQLASWEQPLEFLGGMLPTTEIRKLTVQLLTAEPQLEMARVLRRLLRGRRYREQEGDDVVLRQMEQATLSRMTEVSRYPEALFPHIYNHLSWCEEPQATCHAYADGILRPTMNATGRPWLRAETPMPPLREQVFRSDSSIISLAVYAPGEFVAGHRDGTVRRWGVDTGECQILYRHEGIGIARSLAVDVRDGSVLSGGYDGTVRRWRPGQSDAEILYAHEGWVHTVAVDVRDGSVLSGGSDCTVRTVRRWRPGQNDAEILYAHEGEVYTVAVDVRDGSVLSGGSDCTVRRWRPGQNDAEILYAHEGEVYTVAVDVRDGSVLSGGADETVRRWRPGQNDAEILYRHEGKVHSVAVNDRDGSVLSGGADETVRRWRPGQNDADSLYRHEGGVWSVAVDVRDGSVLSGGSDCTVRRWRPGQNNDRILYRNEGRAYSVAMDVRDGSVLSGRADGSVRRWRPGQNDGDILYKHEGGVRSVALDVRDGSVLSGGSDCTVRRWRPGQNDGDILYRHRRSVWSVAVDVRDGSVLSGGYDDTVRRWRPGQNDADSLYRHEGGVWSVAVDVRDGSVLSGGNDHTVSRWRPGQNHAEILYRHERGVRSVAVDVRDGSVLSGGHDYTVRRWRPGQNDADILYRHEHWVRTVTVDVWDGSVLSGGDDANLRLFRLALCDFLMLLTPYSIHSVSCSLRHNRIALALGDGRLVLVRVEPSVEALLQWRSHPSTGGKFNSEQPQQ